MELKSEGANGTYLLKSLDTFQMFFDEGVPYLLFLKEMSLTFLGSSSLKHLIHLGIPS